jgi:hypothetical protein
MSVKYQVFVSSTYDDLRAEREQVVKAILEMGHIPVGMEMFSAADEQQFQIISHHIESSDYYVVIVAHRYGSMEGDRSFTEKEYDYAVQCGIPILGFPIADSVAWPPANIDKDKKTRDALARFKEKVKSRYISQWTSTSDLYGKVSIALSKQITANPRTGWVRADQAAGPEILAELARLSKENSDLRSQLAGARRSLGGDARETWKEFIDRAYECRQAVLKEAGLRQMARGPEEREAAERELDLKLHELDKTVVKLEFLGPEQANNVEQARQLMLRINKGQAQTGDIQSFAKSVAASLRYSSEGPLDTLIDT